MITAIEERALRILVAALLQSELSINELRKISNSLVTSPSLSFALAEFLENFADNAGSRRAKVEQPFSNHTGENAEIYQLVRSKKLAKRRLAEILTAISPSMAANFNTEKSSQAMLEEFLVLATGSEKDELRRKLQGRGGDDPFLAGITRLR